MGSDCFPSPFRQGQRLIQSGVRHRDDKFLATPTRQLIRLANLAFGDLAEFLQYAVWSSYQTLHVATQLFQSSDIVQQQSRHCSTAGQCGQQNRPCIQ